MTAAHVTASCFSCWIMRNPDRQPTRVVTETSDVCGFCGLPTIAGIYVMATADEAPYASEATS